MIQPAFAAECKRLDTENAALRALLREWYDMFAPVRKPNTEGAVLIDKTAIALRAEFQYREGES